MEKRRMGACLLDRSDAWVRAVFHSSLSLSLSLVFILKLRARAQFVVF